MDGTAKKISIFQYKKQKDSEQQVQQKQLPAQAVAPELPDLERENAAIVLQMQSTLSCLLDAATGKPIEERILRELPSMMRAEGREIAKICFLNFILKNFLLESMPGLQEDAMLRDVLYNWLKICFASLQKPDSKQPCAGQVCLQIFDAIRKICFTEEYLCTSKFMKLFSNFTLLPAGPTETEQEIQRKAQILFTGWSKKVAAAKMLATSSRSGCKLQTAEQAAVAAPEEAIAIPKRQITHIDSSQAKQQKSELPQNLLSEPVNRIKKVTFASEDVLCSVRYYTPEETHDSRGKDAYAESERQEASFALRKTNQEELAWKQPPYKSASKEYISAEQKVQEERERTVLSVTYYNSQHIPFSPAEPPVDPTGPTPDSIIPLIPLHEIQLAAAQPQVAGMQVSTPVFDANALSLLLQSPDILRLLKNK